MSVRMAPNGIRQPVLWRIRDIGEVFEWVLGGYREDESFLDTAGGVEGIARTGPTVSAAGPIAVDTINDQLIYYGGAKKNDCL